PCSTPAGMARASALNPSAGSKTMRPSMAKLLTRPPGFVRLVRTPWSLASSRGEIVSGECGLLPRAQARAAEARTEAAALAGDAVHMERGAMPHERVLDDREPQARAAALARTAAIDTVEALREPRDVLGGDAHARILDRELGALVGLAPREPHDAAIGRIAHRVAHQVAERARELLLAADEVDRRRGLGLDAV